MNLGRPIAGPGYLACDYEFPDPVTGDYLLYDYIGVSYFPGTRDLPKGDPVRGVGQAASWDPGSSALFVRTRHGVVWIQISVAGLNGRDPKDIAVQVFRLAAPRLP